MSEETNSSVPSSETATPEPSPEPSKSPPPKGVDKKLWIKIAAVAVVALLIASVVYVMFLAPMTATIEPAGDTLSVDAGKVLTLSIKVKKGFSDITDKEDIKFLWTVLPNTLGSWQRSAKAVVNLTAGKVEGAGTVTCEVTYKGEELVVSKPLSVLPPYLDQILVRPSTKTLERSMVYNFSAVATDSVANTIPGLVYTWSINGDVAAQCKLNTTTGVYVQFTSSPTYGNVTLNATATYKGMTKTGGARVTIGPLPPRSADYYWYDMFEVPFGEWWDMRAKVGKAEVPLTHEYPYLFKWVGFPAGNEWIYTNMRLNITAENMTEVNMNERPEFLPLHGNARGGTAVIDWYLQYLTEEEMKRFPDATAGWSDGWVVSLNGTVTLDEEAALSVLLGLTSEGYDDFKDWWTLHKSEVKGDFDNWFKYEAGKDRLDIFPAYDYAFTTLAWDINAEKVGDKIVLHYDLVTWGMEMLLSMWMREAFMPTEWYFEDMDFHATIGPEWTDLKADAAVAYAVYAYESTNRPGEPCWVWEALLQDYVEAGPPENRVSLYNKYADFEYLNTAPGSAWYDEMMIYDYTPTAWNLSENETLTIEWPAGEQIFKVHVSPDGVVNGTANHSSEMVMNYSEPFWSDVGALFPGNFSIDNDTNRMTFTGPIDMWHWSQLQSNPEHWWLTSEWERMDLLPYGAPYIEFKPKVFVPEPDKLMIDVEDLIVVNTTADVSVTCFDQFRRVYEKYDGTVTFSSNRTDVILPDDYEFKSADNGTVVLPASLNFTGLGWYTVNVSDKNNESIRIGSTTNIYVVKDPPVIDHFKVEVPGYKGLIVPELPTDVYVTAINQYDNRTFKTYAGTVTFSTNATPGSYEMPMDFTFDPLMKGFAIIPGLTFDEGGVHSLTVSDTITTTATGTVNVTVSDRRPDVDYRMYDIMEEPWHDWWEPRLDAYDTDIILSNEPHRYTMVYNPDKAFYHGVIMAPYRWNVTALNMPTLNVDDPCLMPVFGETEIEGASADLDVYFQYLDQEWWDSYWIPTWKNDPDSGWTSAIDGIFDAQVLDGYYIGTVYTATMNREAAKTWLNMPVYVDPGAWWVENKASYIDAWEEWIDYQANVVYDIYAGYEWAYIPLATIMTLDVVGEDIVLNIAHFNWGYEVLITRWMTDRSICTHEPYMEDFQLVAHMESDYVDLTYDGVAQWSLRAVKANQTDSDAAWLWEPQHIDYISWESPYTGDSEFEPWDSLQYVSWCSGDMTLGGDWYEWYYGYLEWEDYSEVPFSVDYDFTPTYFDLTSYMTFTVQLPTGNDVLGYRGLALPGNSFEPDQLGGSIYDLRFNGITAPYDGISIYGPMWFGWHGYPDVPGAPDLSSMYNNVTKTLVINGPMKFENYHHASGQLYHSAPCLEFNVANWSWPGATTLSLPVPADPVAESSSGVSMSAAMVAQAIALALSIVATVLVVAENRRKD